MNAFSFDLSLRNRNTLRTSGAIAFAILTALSAKSQTFGSQIGIFPTGNPDPDGFAAISDETTRKDVVFSAVDSNGRELWVTDGTIPGTRRLTNLNPTGNSVERDPNVLSVRRDGIDYVYFQGRNANDPAGLQLYEWYRSNSNDVITSKSGSNVSVEPQPMVADDVGRIYYHVRANPTNQGELWMLPSSAAPPVRILGANETLLNAGSLATATHQGQSVLLFSGLEPWWGWELWVYDPIGTPLGARRVSNLASGLSAAGPSDQLVLGDHHVFIAEDTQGMTVFSGRISNYLSTVTFVGPSVLLATTGRIRNPSDVAVCDDHIYAVGTITTSSSGPYYLCRYDPNVAGAMTPIMTMATDTKLVCAGRKLFFRASTGTTTQIYVVHDNISAPVAIASASSLSNIGSDLFACGTDGIVFTATDAVAGPGLYFSNGQQTTRLNGQSSMQDFTRSGRNLVWSAAVGANRRAFSSDLAQTGGFLFESFGTGSLASNGPPQLRRISDPTISNVPEAGGVLAVQIFRGDGAVVPAPGGLPVYFASPSVPVNVSISPTHSCDFWPWQSQPLPPFYIMTDNVGRLLVTIPPTPVLTGTHYVLQAVMPDTLGTCGVSGIALTNPIDVVFR